MRKGEDKDGGKGIPFGGTTPVTKILPVSVPSIGLPIGEKERGDRWVKED